MATELFAFTAEERAIFLRMKDKFLKSEQSGLILPEEIHTTQAPEVYLAELPTAGIAPMGVDVGTASGTGSGLADVSHSAQCQIYRMQYNKATTKYAPVIVTGLQVLVHNVTPSWVFKCYAIVTRDKFGDWLLTQPWITSWEGKTVGAIASKGSGLVNIWKNGAVTSPLWRVTAWLNWMNGTSTIAANKEVWVDWNPFDVNADGRLGRWIVREREC